MKLFIKMEQFKYLKHLEKIVKLDSNIIESFMVNFKFQEVFTLGILV